MTNSFSRLGMFWAKNHGSIYSKDFPDLTLKDPFGNKARWVELKAEEKHIANLKSLRPKELTTGQLNKLQELGCGRNVGGLLAVEYVGRPGETNTLHVMVPRHFSMDFGAGHGGYANLVASQDSRMPVIYPVTGQLVVAYTPTERSGREFDRFIWWVLLESWWRWQNQEFAATDLITLAWPTPLGLIDWSHATFSIRH